MGVIACRSREAALIPNYIPWYELTYDAMLQQRSEHLPVRGAEPLYPG